MHHKVAGWRDGIKLGTLCNCEVIYHLAIFYCRGNGFWAGLVPAQKAMYCIMASSLMRIVCFLLYTGLAHYASATFAVVPACGALGQGMVVAAPNEYGCGHHAVVVVALNGTHLLAVFLEFIEVEFVCGLQAAFYVEFVAQGFYQKIYYHRFGGIIGVEAPTARTPLLYLLLRCAAEEVAVLAGYFV